MTLPPLPAWESMHPQIVHFPIALLLTAGVLAALGLLPRIGRGFALSALVLMALGTIAAFVASEAGEASAQLVIRTPQISELLQRHQEYASTVRLVYTILTIVYALVLFAPAALPKLKLLLKPLPPLVPFAAQVVFILIYLGCGVILANTGHLGGRLVHEFGVHVLVPG